MQNGMKISKNSRINQGESIGIQTKRHKETPLPKILSIKSQSLSKV